MPLLSKPLAVSAYSTTNGRRKTKKKKYSYTAETLATAAEWVRVGHMSQRHAAQFFDIPRSTLRHEVDGDRPRSRATAQRVFSDEEEVDFCDMIEAFARKRRPLTGSQFLVIVNKFLVRRSAARGELHRPRLGRGFLAAFRKRHPRAAAQRVPEAVERKRDRASRIEAHKYFNKLEQLYAQHGFHDAPHRIFNCDESGLQTGAVKTKVLAPRGMRDVSTVAGNCLRINYTVLACVSAAGLALPPYVLYKALRDIHHGWVQGGPPGTHYDATPNGWINEGSFLRVRLIHKWLQ